VNPVRDDARQPLPAPSAPRPALRASELPDALAVLRTGVAVVAPDWTVRFANAAWGAVGEVTPGRSLWSTTPALRGEPTEPLLRATMSDGRARAMRVRARRADAPWLELRATRIAGGGLALEARESAAAPDPEPARIVHALGDAVMAVDALWRITAWNAAAERLTGLRREQVLGHLLWDAWPGVHDSVAGRAWRDTMERREAREVVHWVPESGLPALAADALDGRSLPLGGGGVAIVLARAAAEQPVEGEIAETAGENRLLRELSRHLAAVQDSDELFALISETVRRECGGSGAGVSVLEGDHVRVLAATGRGIPAAGTTFPVRHSLSERVTLLRRVVRQSSYRAPVPQVRRAFEAEGVVELMLAPIIAYDRTIGIVSVVRRASDLPFADSDERRLQLIADHAAVAVSKSRLLEEAHAANHAKSNFLATMSHELRTPLTALTGYGELLTDEIVGPLSAPQKDVVERMRSVTQHLSVMIDELLTFSSLEAGRERAKPHEVDSGDVLRAAALVIEPLAHQRALGFTIDVPAGAPTLVTDPAMVRQILVNLGGNAVKFTERGMVSMVLRHDPSMVRFEVRDTGIGISRDDQARLFRPFTQLDASLTRRYGGTGLGLHIANRLAHILGGTIEVSSQPGQGSTFAVVLPRRGAEPR
jgi:signal transduction histidine kinase/PAS domain-containing protein